MIATGANAQYGHIMRKCAHRWFPLAVEREADAIKAQFVNEILVAFGAGTMAAKVMGEHDRFLEQSCFRAMKARFWAGDHFPACGQRSVTFS